MLSPRFTGLAFVGLLAVVNVAAMPVPEPIQVRVVDIYLSLSRIDISFISAAWLSATRPHLNRFRRMSSVTLYVCVVSDCAQHY